MLGEPAIELSRRQVRIYPQRNLFSHILGQTDEDNKGISGVESHFNNQILNTKFSDTSFQITLDTVIQSQVRETLEKAIADYSARGAQPINEHDKNLKRDLTTTEILVKSSNIGTVKIIEKIGIENHKNFLTKLGIFDKASVELPEKGKSLPMKWDNCTLATASYGHGISTTPIQLASAYASLVNGGYKIYPTLVKQNQNIKKERIISEETSKKMVKMLRKVVDKNDPMQGTARTADINGYSVIGKTGTAVKVSKTSKGYSKDVMTVFVSAYPEEKPEYLLLVMIDEPKAIPSKGYFKSDSGWNAVPTAGTIIKRIGPILVSKNYNIALNVK